MKNNHNNNREDLNIGIVLPVFNVDKTISKVLSSIDEALSNLEFRFNLLIIDNDSTDQTLSLIKKYYSKNPKFSENVTILVNEVNDGYGSSIKVGFKYFISQPVSHLIIIHGDYQTSPLKLINTFISTYQKNPEIDFILASRFMKESGIENYSLVRKLGNYFFNYLTYFCCGHKISDNGAAMIMIKANILKDLPFSSLSNTWQFHPQFNILLFENKLKHTEFPMKWEDSDAVSSISLVPYGIKLLKILLSYWLNKNIFKKEIDARFKPEPLPSEKKSNILILD